MIRMIATSVLAVSLLAPAPAAAAHTSAVRVFKASVAAPGQFDLTLAEVRFRGRAHAAGTLSSASRLARSIRLSLTGPSGLDYVAGAVTRFTVHRRPRILVLVVNRRPRGSLAPDLARIGVAITAPRRVGAPELLQASDPFTRPRSGRQIPVPCDLPAGGAGGSLAASALRPLLARGAALEGFSGPAAIAQAYDAVCGKPYAAAFRQAVTRGSTPTCESADVKSLPCCPPNALCAPQPCSACPCQACGCAPCACGTCPCQGCTCTCGCSPCGCAPCACATTPCVAGGQSTGLAAKASIACPLPATPVICPL
jgi:hypothetical protein